ncbi:CbrC family protein [Aliikangiella sp. G2MR2-5]|uniref:CbrC family protein n=1 Tax=Aliikangiella sp. G2MR2-5 TaxID=2788943 RepID=UPI0018A95A64|nr:CbrC family protein [Aliikangiella sp. G2MR2-5]
MTLPTFKYHPDPLGNGSIEESDEICGCCGKARGYIYCPVIYSRQSVPPVCPWFIADGSVAAKYDAEFVDSHPLYQGGASEEAIEEVSKRTPGYFSIQQEQWLCHCNDACEYHGEASLADLKAVKDDELAKIFESTYLDENEWQSLLANYSPGSGECLKFVCRHCGDIRIGLDLD